MEGNLKLILGLVWALIQRYQLGRHTKVPPKRLLLAWLQACLPRLKLSNFRACWNDGRLLSALLCYCDAQLLPDWAGLDPAQG